VTLAGPQVGVGILRPVGVALAGFFFWFPVGIFVMEEESLGLLGLSEAPLVGESTVVVKRKKRPTTKRIWIITYGAAGPSITHEIIHNDTKVEVDECYTTTDSMHECIRSRETCAHAFCR